MTENEHKLLQSAKLAQALTEIMVKALNTLDAELARSVEEIGYNLELLKALSSQVSLPFYTDSLSDALISDYIEESKDGAKETDFVSFNPSFATELFADKNGIPSANILMVEANKLGAFAEELLNKQEKEHDNEITEIMKKDNARWRK